MADIDDSIIEIYVHSKQGFGDDRGPDSRLQLLITTSSPQMAHLVYHRAALFERRVQLLPRWRADGSSTPSQPSGGYPLLHHYPLWHRPLWHRQLRWITAAAKTALSARLFGRFPARRPGHNPASRLTPMDRASTDGNGGPAAERTSRTAGSRPPAAVSEFRRPQLADQVVGRLRALIAQGGLAQGQRLPSEAAIGREFGVGRSTVREALKTLSHLGLIETRAGSGSYVTGHLRGHPPSVMSGEELGELFEFRFILESKIAPLTAERRSTGQLAEVLYRLEQLQVAAAAEDPDLLVEADLSFHRSVATACGNRFLIATYSHNQPAFEKGTRVLIGMQSSTHIGDVHDELAEAIVAKDTGGAVSAVRRTFDEIRMRLPLLTD